LYRTGDRVVWNREGAIEFLGRFDHQVKIRGFRIEPGEIESALLDHESVAQAVVLALQDRPENKRLVAYVAGAGIDLPALRSHISKRLPAHMLPSAFVVMATLPLNLNGKVDRRLLPPPSSEAEPTRELVAPRSDVEKAVASIWREVLGVESFSIHDNFFDLGGHSLSLARVHAKLSEAFRPRKISVVELFEHPTVASLAAHLASEDGRQGASASKAPKETHEAAKRSEGASRLQKRLRMSQAERRK
ncbi:MAG: phosphopantetheine-binding protein, partial [Vicinamibacteria bacterium]